MRKKGTDGIKSKKILNSSDGGYQLKRILLNRLKLHNLDFCLVSSLFSSVAGFSSLRDGGELICKVEIKFGLGRELE